MTVVLVSQFLFLANTLEVHERNGFCVKIRETVEVETSKTKILPFFCETCFVSLRFALQLQLSSKHPSSFKKGLTLISSMIFSFRLSITVHTIFEELFILDSQETVAQNHKPL